MNCKLFQRDLALAAASCLEAERLLQMQEHCRGCPACAARLQEYQSVAAEHTGTAMELRDAPLRCALDLRERLPMNARFHGACDVVWRWLLPAGAAAGLILALIIARRPPSTSVGTAPLAPPHAPAQVSSPSPSLGAYRSAFNAAGEPSLDALLARHEHHLLHPGHANDTLGAATGRRFGVGNFNRALD